MPAQWPAGSYFVLLDGAPQQIELPASGRNLVQYFQIGPAAGPYPDYSYRKLSAAFVGNGLRPNAPLHLAEKGTVWIWNFLGSGARVWMGHLGIWLRLRCQKHRSYTRRKFFRVPIFYAKNKSIKLNCVIAPRCRRSMVHMGRFSWKWRSSLKVSALACFENMVSRFSGLRRLRLSCRMFREGHGLRIG